MMPLPKEYAYGMLRASLRGLSGAVQTVASAANYSLNAARDCDLLTGGDERELLEHAARLRQAAETLEKAAALAKPLPRLVRLQAAE